MADPSKIAQPKIGGGQIIGHNAITGSPVQARAPTMQHNPVIVSSPTVPITTTATGVTTAMYLPGASTDVPLPTARVLDKQRINSLLQDVDPLEQLDEDVEEMMLQITDDFIDNVVTSACQLAKHRKANTVEVKDVQLHLERNWNMWVPGFGSGEVKPFKKTATTEAHRQRLALIKKTLKKY